MLTYWFGWFEDNWLLHLGAIVIQMRFHVIIDVLKLHKLIGLLQMIKCYDENVKTSRFLSKHVTSEQKVLSVVK